MTVHYPDIADQSSRVKPARSSQFKFKRAVFYRGGIKRVMDVGLVLISAPVIVPAVLALALLIWMRDFRNPFYSQERVGMGGTVFTMWKLRSMVVDADKKLEQHLQVNPKARAEWDSKQKLIEDPRITPVGQLLRKTSLDELPQLLNVLKGDMSLVGPRPMMPQQKHLYPSQVYYKLRPGVTGLWQISDRHQSAFTTRAKFDRDYYKNVCFATDAKIILKTFKVIACGTGC